MIFTRTCDCRKKRMLHLLVIVQEHSFRTLYLFILVHSVVKALSPYVSSHKPRTPVSQCGYVSVNVASINETVYPKLHEDLSKATVGVEKSIFMLFCCDCLKNRTSYFLVTVQRIAEWDVIFQRYHYNSLSCV